MGIPKYGVSTTKDAGDIASEASKAAGAKINDAAAAKKAEQAKVDAEIAKNEEAKVKEDIAKLKESKPETLAGREAKEAKLKALEGKVEEKNGEKAAEAAAAVAPKDE